MDSFGGSIPFLVIGIIRRKYSPEPRDFVSIVSVGFSTVPDLTMDSTLWVIGVCSHLRVDIFSDV